MSQQMKINAIAPWYGANRMLAEEVGRALAGCTWVGVVFAGGMAELPHITARAIVVNDKHRHVMNLASVLATPGMPERLAAQLDGLPFHPDTLQWAQNYCREMERAGWDLGNVATSELSEKWAINYFVCSWMGRSALAGTPGEFRGGLPVRWSATGGDSNTRYRSAIESLAAWGAVMRRCNFTTIAWEQFLDKCKDEPAHGIYCDPPFPGPGDKYTHTMSEGDHLRLAKALEQFQRARVVCRFYDHPLVRELYPEPRWIWRRLKGRDGCNNADKPEVLITNGR